MQGRPSRAPMPPPPPPPPSALAAHLTKPAPATFIADHCARRLHSRSKAGQLAWSAILGPQLAARPQAFCTRQQTLMHRLQLMLSQPAACAVQPCLAARPATAATAACRPAAQWPAWSSRSRWMHRSPRFHCTQRLTGPPGSLVCVLQQLLTLSSAPRLTPLRPPLARQPAAAAASGSGSSSGGGSSSGSSSSGGSKGSSSSKAAEAAAAKQRLQQYLQQQPGISDSEAAKLAEQLAGALRQADEAAPPPLQFFVQRGMQPLQAAQLMAKICSYDKSYIQQWPTWQPVFAANWQLADGYLRAYSQHCDATSQQPTKGGDSLAALLSTQPSRWQLLHVAALQQKLEVLQQAPASLSHADVGQLIAGGLACTGKMETFASAIAWLGRFAGSVDAAISMLRQAPALTGYSAATLDSKVAALEAAWAGVLQRQQVAQLVRRSALVLMCDAERYAPTAAVLRGWFSQPGELRAVLDKAPALLAALAAALQATERYLMGPPLSLSRQDFLALVKAAPQAFHMDLSNDLAQHKLAFLTDVRVWMGAQWGRLGGGAACWQRRTALRAASQCFTPAHLSPPPAGGRRAAGARAVGQLPRLPQIQPHGAGRPLLPAARPWRAAAAGPAGWRHRAVICDLGPAPAARVHAAARRPGPAAGGRPPGAGRRPRLAAALA